MKYEKYLKDYYNMESNITLYDYLRCRQLMSVVDIYSIDEETNEEYFATLGREDSENLNGTQKAYKVVRINNDNIIIYIGKEV